MKYSKERIEHDWNYCLNYIEIFGKDDREGKNKTLATMKAIYERAAKEYGFEYAESLPKGNLIKDKNQ